MDVPFFFGLGIMALSFIQAKTVDFLKQKRQCQLLKPGKNIAKGRPIVLAEIEFIAPCPQVSWVFFSMTRSTRGFDLWLEVAVQPQIFDRLHQDHAKRMWILEAKNAGKSHGVMIKGWVSLDWYWWHYPGPQYLWYNRL